MVTTDAILFFGFLVDEDVELPFGSETSFENFEDWLLAKLDIPNPYDHFPDVSGLLRYEENCVVNAWGQSNQKAIDEYHHAKRDALRRLLGRTGLLLDMAWPKNKRSVSEACKTDA